MDRYKAKPQEAPFLAMLAAEFASEYRVISISSSDITSRRDSRAGVKRYVLKDNLGVVQKRTRTKPSVIRFEKFNKEKEPERYHLTLLELYLPHHQENQLTPAPFETYSFS